MSKLIFWKSSILALPCFLLVRIKVREPTDHTGRNRARKMPQADRHFAACARSGFTCYQWDRVWQALNYPVDTGLLSACESIWYLGTLIRKLSEVSELLNFYAMSRAVSFATLVMLKTKEFGGLGRLKLITVFMGFSVAKRKNPDGMNVIIFTALA